MKNLGDKISKGISVLSGDIVDGVKETSKAIQNSDSSQYSYRNGEQSQGLS